MTNREIFAFALTPAFAPTIPALQLTFQSTFLEIPLSTYFKNPRLISTTLEVFAGNFTIVGFFGIPIAYVFALGLALPIYLVLRRDNRVTYPYLLLFGILISLVFAIGDRPESILHWAAIGAFLATVFRAIRGKFENA